MSRAGWLEVVVLSLAGEAQAWLDRNPWLLFDALVLGSVSALLLLFLWPFLVATRR